MIYTDPEDGSRVLATDKNRNGPAPRAINMAMTEKGLTVLGVLDDSEQRAAKERATSEEDDDEDDDDDEFAELDDIDVPELDIDEKKDPDAPPGDASSDDAKHAPHERPAGDDEGD